MLDLTSIKNIIDTLNWILTLGKSDLVQVQNETDELIRELSASLIHLWDVTTEITKSSASAITEVEFENTYQYFYRFYLGDPNISIARTHCSNISRDVDRIKFKLANILHTDIGKWSEIDLQLSSIIHNDIDILMDYDNCIKTLHDRMLAIRGNFKTGDTASAQKLYSTLKKELENDIEQLRLGVATMEKAINHVRKTSG